MTEKLEHKAGTGRIGSMKGKNWLDLIFVPSSMFRFVKNKVDWGEDEVGRAGKYSAYAFATVGELMRLYSYVDLYKSYLQ